MQDALVEILVKILIKHPAQVRKLNIKYAKHPKRAILRRNPFWPILAVLAAILERAACASE